MKFILFSKIQFYVENPIALIESYCFQNDFYSRYDLLENRNIQDVNKIGARIKLDLLPQCKAIIDNSGDLEIFKYSLGNFLNLDEKIRNKHIHDLNNRIVQNLLMLPKIGLSKVTKILHTLYREIIPIIDNPLQNVYRQINYSWKEYEAEQIFIDYYNNLLNEQNRENLDKIEYEILKINLKGLTRIRIFDILWWSYLKADRLGREKNIRWLSIKRVGI